MSCAANAYFPRFFSVKYHPKRTLDIIYIILILIGAYARPSLSRTPVHGRRFAIFCALREIWIEANASASRLSGILNASVLLERKACRHVRRLGCRRFEVWKICIFLSSAAFRHIGSDCGARLYLASGKVFSMLGGVCRVYLLLKFWCKFDPFERRWLTMSLSRLGRGVWRKTDIEASVQGGGSCAIASAAVFENAWWEKNFGVKRGGKIALATLK